MSSSQQLLLGEGAGGGPPVFIEDVFSTYLYTGTGATQTITNNIDLSTKGGLVWIKQRNADTYGHNLVDTVRGNTKYIYSENTSAQETEANHVTSFNTSGFTLGSGNTLNLSAATFASWTFRKQPKFFDIQEWTGDGSGYRTISHNLGSVPGCIIIKCTSNATNWATYHRYNGTTGIALNLNTTASSGQPTTIDNGYVENDPTTVTSTSFDVVAGGGASIGRQNVNASGYTYVAYIFAHDAGGFGLTGSDNVISCGSYTGNGSTTGPVITLGYEPQWLLVKRSSTAGNDWILFDNMRGMPVGSVDSFLRPNTYQAEDSLTDYVSPTATGFNIVSASSNVNTNTNTYIYIAIRRGPMKVPTVGTSVYNGVNDNSGLINVGFVPDLALVNTKAQWDRNPAYARLYGAFALRTNDTSAEESATVYWNAKTGYFEQSNTGGTPMSWFFGRAPGYFDVVCYSGTGTVNSKNHNLGVVPELIIVKKRSAGGLGRPWYTYVAPLGVNAQLLLNTNEAVVPESFMDGVAPTSSVFTLYSGVQVNGSGDTYVAYLFATCPGVSKVGSYTGTGTTLQINCGFTSGARFVMIKRTSSTGDWYVWDSTRGIIAGNDPYLLMNSVAAEVTGTDYVDTYSAGFEISSTAPAAINGSGGTFIFLAIA